MNDQNYPTASWSDDLFNWIRRQGLYRADPRALGGVFAGLAHKMGWQLGLTRFLGTIILLFSGVGVAVYAIAWMFLPEGGTGRIIFESWMREGAFKIFAFILLAIIFFGIVGTGSHREHSFFWLMMLAAAALVALGSTRNSHRKHPPQGPPSGAPAAYNAAATPGHPQSGPQPPQPVGYRDAGYPSFSGNNPAAPDPVATYVPPSQPQQPHRPASTWTQPPAPQGQQDVAWMRPGPTRRAGWLFWALAFGLITAILAVQMFSSQLDWRTVTTITVALPLFSLGAYYIILAACGYRLGWTGALGSIVLVVSLLTPTFGFGPGYMSIGETKLPANSIQEGNVEYSRLGIGELEIPVNVDEAVFYHLSLTSFGKIDWKQVPELVVIEYDDCALGEAKPRNLSGFGCSITLATPAAQKVQDDPDKLSFVNASVALGEIKLIRSPEDLKRPKSHSIPAKPTPEAPKHSPELSTPTTESSAENKLNHALKQGN